jgi:glycosyltransferase involved in cell wall biosynthesis/GT2 family glycosyltransferase
MSKFTVIVNTYPNPTRDEDLRKCLSSLINQTYQDFDILVVENFQDRSEIEKVLIKFDQFKNKITVITNPTKKLSFLFNLGWKSTKNEYLAFLADDAEAEPVWLENIYIELEKDPKTAVVSGPVISACYPTCEMHRIYLLSQKNMLFKLLAWPYLHFATEGKIQKPGNLFESGAYSFGASLEESKTFERQEIDLATTTSMGIKRSVLEGIGGFDENFSFNHADGDLFIRIKKQGYKIIFNPKVVAHHNVRIGPSRNAYIIGEDTGKFYRKDIRPKTLRGWVGAILNIKILNLYWIYNFLRTGDPKQLKGISGFINGLFFENQIKIDLSNKKLNILFINRWVGYNEGGNETHIKDLMDQFSKGGHKVSVITTEGTALNYLKDKIKIEFVKGKKGYFSNEVFGVFGALIFLIKCFVKFIELYLSGERYDLISVHFSLEAFLARFIKLFFGTPYVLVLAGDTSLELIEGRRADGKIAISNFMNDQCKKYGYNSEIIPKGIDLTRFSPDINSYDLYREKDINGKSVVLTVARLDPRKNLITLIKAADEIVSKKGIKNIIFYIIGDGIEKKMLEENIKKYKLESYIKLEGAIENSNPLFAKYYAMSSLFVLPTLYEGFGWVYLEAMASGLPIITTKVGSNPEIVGDVGVLIEPKNPVLLADIIVNTLNDKTKLLDMKKKGLEKVKNYSWENIIGRCEDYYQEVSKKKCEDLDCKLKVLGYVIIDIIEIVLDGIENFIASVRNKSKGEWTGLGQEGIKE